MEWFILMGLSKALCLLMVNHVFRSDAVRIISARKARPRHTEREMKICKEYNFSAAHKNPSAARLKKQVTIRLDRK